MDEKELQNYFAEFLEEKGFPSSTLRRDSYPISGGKLPSLKADLTVIDPNSQRVIAVFELKRLKKPEHEYEFRYQLTKFKQKRGYENAAIFAVFPNMDKEKWRPFEIYEVLDPDTWRLVLESEFPNFSTLVARAKNQAQLELAIKTEKTTDYFLIVSWTSGVIALIFFVLDIVDLLRMTGQQLTLLGLAIALFLIPFAAKLKILGLEFERLDKQTPQEEK